MNELILLIPILLPVIAGVLAGFLPLCAATVRFIRL